MRWSVSVVMTGAALLWAGAATAAQETPAVPSGIMLELQEIRVEEGDGGTLARFRYVAADLDRFGFAGVVEDFPALCSDVVLPWAASHAPVARVVISIASAPLEFGTNAPDVTQFFEMFRLEPTACIWEGL